MQGLLGMFILELRIIIQRVASGLRKITRLREMRARGKRERERNEGKENLFSLVLVHSG